MSIDTSVSTVDQKTYRRLGSELWQLSYPTMIASALQTVYDIVDMAWVGKISKEAMAGVTLFSTFYMLFTFLNEVAGTSSISMIAQAYGRKDMERTQKVAEQTISFKIILAVISSILMLLFLNPLLDLYLGNGPKDAIVKKAALDYGYIRIFFIPMMFSSYSVNTIFRTTDDAKTPMRIMIISAVLNLILDPLFMFDVIPGTSIPGLGLGVFGAALATVIASTVAFLYGFFLLLSGRRELKISIKGLLTLDRSIDLPMLTIGMPAGLHMLIRRAFNTLLIKFVTIYGTAAVAISGISGKLMTFAFTPIFGLMMAGSTLVGHALGQEKVDEALALSKLASRINVAVVFCLTLPAFIFPEAVIKIFNDDPFVVQEGVHMLRFISLSALLTAFSFGKKIVFSGSGYNKPQLFSGLGSRWLVHLPLLYLFVKVWQLPLKYLWLTYLIAEVAEVAITMAFFKSGDWLKRRV